MLIVHISDLHIRNSKYRAEYNAAFSDLYRQLEEIQPDLIINTGDTVHSKLAVSPELFDDVATHMRKVAEIAPYWVVLGNHDLNLKNINRTDAISPIVRAIDDPRVRLLEPGPHYHPDPSFYRYVFWNYDIRSRNHEFVVDESAVNIGLFHGSISGCKTDMGFVMEEGEAEVSSFEQMDYVLLGDIHKRQSFKGGRMQYPGSLIQQNYGEELEKGFLAWSIADKENFGVRFHEVKAPGRFYTVTVPKDLDLTGIDVPAGSRIRIHLEGELTPSKRIELEKLIKAELKPCEIITPDVGLAEQLEELDVDRLVGSRETMMREHLKEKGCTDKQIEDVLALWAKLQTELDDEAARGSTWSLRSIAWDNMFNYGANNSLEMAKLRGLVGIFAPNASGKSSIFDIILETLFDKISKEAPRNIDLINDNKDSGSMTAILEADEKTYTIEREIERISYGQRKLTETKQWGKTSLDFSVGEESLNGTSRPETERSIREIIGSFEDFSLTTMVSQNPIFGLPGGGDIINCKETDRRKILFRFLDLDIYEKVNQICKDELKAIFGSLKNQSKESLLEQIQEIDNALCLRSSDINSLRKNNSSLEEEVKQLLAELTLSGTEDAQKLINEELAAGKKVAETMSHLLQTQKKAIAEKATLELIHQESLKRWESRPDVPSVTLQDVVDEIERRNNRRESLKLSISRGKDELKSCKNAQDTLEGIPCEGKFPTCKFISDAVGLVSRHDEVQKAITTLVGEASEEDRELAVLRTHQVQHRSVADWERRSAEISLKLEQQAHITSDAQHAHARAQEAFANASLAHEDVKKRLSNSSAEKVIDLRENLAWRENLLAEGRKELEEDLRSSGALESKKAALVQESTLLAERQQIAEVYEILSEMTSKTGLPYRILSKVLPLVNHEISKILTGVTKFSVFFEDDSDTQSVSLFIRYGDYKSRPLGLGSGAEKFIAALAVRCALLSVSSLPKTDMLIIDEGFGKLDPEHLEALQRMFEYLKGAFGTVFIVSHVDFMRDIVDHSIDIVSKDGYAHVSV